MRPGATKSDEAWVFHPTQTDEPGSSRSGSAIPDQERSGLDAMGAGGEDPDEPLPERLGRFQIVRLLGRGAMGTVLEGYDETLDRRVAVKLLHEGSAGHHQKRLLREAQALARLSHPNVVGVYDAGEHEGRLYIAMELVDGQTLAVWQGTPRPWAECLRVYLEAGRGLMAAHAQGIVHRDFKPTNCILDRQGRVKVLDFGLARGVDDPDDPDDPDDLAAERGADDPTEAVDPALTSAQANLSALSLQLTRTGAMLGTPAYMAPEQATGRPADARSDQFSFCVALYEALHGERPFAGYPGLALATGHGPSLAPPKTPAGLPPVPAWLEAALRRGLSLRQDARFPSMAELLAALERGQRRRRWLGTGLVGATLAVAVGGLAMTRDSPCEGLREAPMPAWGEPQRAAVEQALRAASPEPAAGAWETTAAGLDAYATAWRDAKARACEATRVERVAGEELLELRMACLDRRALQVAATVELLSEADGSTAAHAAQAVRSLPEVEPCLDVERLRRTPPLPPSLERQAEQIRGLVARSWAFDAAGQALRGLEAAQQAIEGARALGDEGASLEAEARLNRGRMYRAIRRLADARDDLEAVLQHAERGADEALALDALQELLRVAQDEDDGSAFGAWMTVARGKLAARADEPRAEARLHYLEGLQALRDEQFARAEASLEQAVEAHRRLGPAASLDTGRALIELGRARARLHHDEQAEQTFARAQALAEGEGLLPLLADVIQERGQLCFDRGRSDEAERWLRRSLELRVGLHGPTAPVTIPPRVQLAMLLQQRGEHEAALAMVDAVRDDLGPEVPDHSRMQVMYLLARVHRQQGDWQAALDDYRRVEQIMAELPTPDPVEQAMLHSSVADCLRVLQRPEAARSRYERAIEALHVHADRDDFRLVYPLYGLASLLDEQGDTVGARNLYRRALQIHQDAPRDREVGAMLHWKLARAGLTGRPEPGPQPERQQALQHLQQARQQYQALGDAEMVAQIDAFRDECGSACLAPSQSR